MLIQNYGLFWHRDEVEWGSRGRAGSLLGHYAYGKSEGNVEFRAQRGVYVLYDDRFSMVYVGQAGRSEKCLFNRLSDHTRDHLAERWSRFSWFGTRGLTYGKAAKQYVLADDEEFRPELSQVLDHLEAILIAAAEPPLNRQSGRFGSASYLYLQTKKPKK